MRSSTDVYLRNCASTGGSRDSSSKRKYSDTNRSPPVKPASLAGLGAAGLHRQRRKVQTGGPAFRLLGQLGELARVQLDAGRFEQHLGLSLIQAEVRHADLVNQAMRPPAAERQRWIFPARDRDLRAGGNVLEQRREHVERGRTCRWRAGRRAPAPPGARAPQARFRAAERGSTKSSRLDPTAPRTPRRAAGRRRELRPRCIAGTPRRRRLCRRARPTRRGADRPRPISQATSSSRNRQGATTVAKGKVDVHSCAIASAFATVPGRGERGSELDLHEVERNFSEGHRGTHATGASPTYFIPTG